MERPDLASITDKGWIEEVAEGESLMDAALRQTWVVVSSTSPTQPPGPAGSPLPWGKKGGPGCWYYHYPHFRHGSTSARRGYITCPESHPCEYRAEA